MVNGFKFIVLYGPKVYLFQPKRYWIDNPDKRRYYTFLALMSGSIVVFVSINHFQLLPEVPKLLLGILGASTILTFHEIVGHNLTNIYSGFWGLHSSNSRVVVSIALVDLIITIPMIPFGVSSQNYTGLLVGIIFLFIYSTTTGRIYLDFVNKRLFEEEFEEIRKHEERKLRRRSERSKDFFHGEDTKNMLVNSELFDRLVRVSTILSIIQMNAHLFPVLLMGFVFILMPLYYSILTYINFITSPTIAFQMKVSISVAAIALLLIIGANAYLNREDFTPDMEKLTQ